MRHNGHQHRPWKYTGDFDYSGMCRQDKADEIDRRNRFSHLDEMTDDDTDDDLSRRLIRDDQLQGRKR